MNRMLWGWMICCALPSFGWTQISFERDRVLLTDTTNCSVSLDRLVDVSRPALTPTRVRVTGYYDSYRWDSFIQRWLLSRTYVTIDFDTVSSGLNPTVTGVFQNVAEVVLRNDLSFPGYRQGRMNFRGLLKASLWNWTYFQAQRKSEISFANQHNLGLMADPNVRTFRFLDLTIGDELSPIATTHVTVTKDGRSTQVRGSFFGRVNLLKVESSGSTEAEVAYLPRTDTEWSDHDEIEGWYSEWVYPLQPDQIRRIVEILSRDRRLYAGRLEYVLGSNVFLIHARSYWQ